MVPCFPLLGLTPSGLFMGLSSTLIYTSELILCSTICVPSATRHNIHMFRERLSYKRGKAYARMSQVIIGNGDFYGCLSEPRGVSAWRKETAQTRVFVLSRSLLLDHLEPQWSKAKLLLPIMPIGIVTYAFTLLWDNLCRNSSRSQGLFSGEKTLGTRLLDNQMRR